jgi:hypothetical protein
MKNMIERVVNKFINENNCPNLRENLIKMLMSDEVFDAMTVKQSKVSFKWKLKNQMLIINNDRENAGLNPIIIRPIDEDLIEDEFYFLQQTNNNWQKDMKKAIIKVMGGLKNNDLGCERVW